MKREEAARPLSDERGGGIPRFRISNFFFDIGLIAVFGG